MKKIWWPTSRYNYAAQAFMLFDWRVSQRETIDKGVVITNSVDGPAGSSATVGSH